VQRLPSQDHSSCDAVLTLASACARQPAPWKNPRSSEDVANRPALFGAQCGPTLSASSTIPPVASIATVLDVNQTLSSPPLSVVLGSHSTGEWTEEAVHISSSTSHCVTLAVKPLEAPLVTLFDARSLSFFIRTLGEMERSAHTDEATSNVSGRPVIDPLQVFPRLYSDAS
jgi:hypothetical protein